MYRSHHLRYRLIIACFVAQSWLLLLLFSPLMQAQRVEKDLASVKPVELRVSGLDNPIGLEEQHPLFGWQLDAVDPAEHDLLQSAYRIQVASSTDLLNGGHGNMWDSGKTISRDYINIPYSGARLHSHTTYFWKVCVWAGSASQPRCGAISKWTTAVLGSGEWVAKWIAAEPDRPLEQQALEHMGKGQTISHALPLFRREFQLDKPLKQAIVYVSGLGQYELRFNGYPVTDAVMTPGWTQYRKSVLYDTYDVTDKLDLGQNALGIMLGNGMYNVQGIENRYTKFIGSFGQPKLFLQMHLLFTDGTQKVIATDRTWQTAPGPITFSSIYGGEDYDARKATAGWDTASSRDAWGAALEVAAPNGSNTSGDLLRSILIPPMRVVEHVQPTSKSVVRPGTYIYDMGRNFSGWPEIRVSGQAGDIIRILPGELLDKSGQVTQRSASAGKTNPVLFTYILRGEGVETWHPRFSYYGFRYLQVETVPAEPGATLPTLVSLAGDFVHDDVSRDGVFKSGNPLLNDIHHLIDQAILSNLASVLTDCPTREKLGWLEQTYLNGASVMYNYGVAQLYQKAVSDMAEAQLPSGMIPSIAPEYVAFVDKNGTSTPFRDSPEWGSAVILSAWNAYQFYGDSRNLAAQYQSMVRYAAYLKSKSVQGLLNFGLGDWFDIGPGHLGASQLTDKQLTATAVYYQDLVTLARIASLLGHPEDSKRYATEAENVKVAFNRALYHPDKKAYDRGSQTANAMPLYLRLVPEEDQASVLANLVADIREHHDHVTAGDIGFHYVVGALLQAGRSDVLYDMLMRTDSPSYGYQLSKGATTLTEAWDTNPGSSQNHFMLGHAEEWLYRGLAGIDFDLSRDDADRIRLRPGLDSGAKDASATLHTVLGQVGSSWQRRGNDWSAMFVIPAGSKATLILPVGATSSETRSRSISGVEVDRLAQRRDRRLAPHLPDRVRAVDQEPGIVHAQRQARRVMEGGEGVAHPQRDQPDPGIVGLLE